MARVKEQVSVSFNDQLVLFRYFLSLFGKQTLSSLAGKLNDAEYEGYDDNQNTYFFDYLDRLCHINQDTVKVNRDQLRLYDENICRYIRQIGEKRGGLKLKYFQYIALLFTEMYLDRYFSDRQAFADELNLYLADARVQSAGAIDPSPYTPESMNKLAFMCATGSGKTLIMHINILQFLHYLKRAQRLNSHLTVNKIILLSPNEGMSTQHLDELSLSSIPASLFRKDMTSSGHPSDVLVIDMNKLKEEGKVKTVSIDSFEQNNLVLVDEAHRGLAGDVWYDYRSRLSAEGGFAFEYSATFKQALSALSPAKKDTDKALSDEYFKAIIMDYSYKYFYEDGYGKEYRIFNLREGIDTEQKHLYLTGCLLSFYQQLKLYSTYSREYAPFEMQEPLLVFVGNRVTATTSKDELTDVEEVLDFIDQFVNYKEKTVKRIRAVLFEDTGLKDGSGNELFSQDFNALKTVFGGNPKPENIYRDMLRLVFNSATEADAPRLHMENLRQVQGEIALKIGDEGDYFGVISIGDPAKLINMCEDQGIVTKTEEFVTDSLFRSINTSSSNIKILIGSRKFSEGWNSWRVSTMGLINFAKSEGSQAIQLFGRGVRLKGYRGCLKRSRKLEDSAISIPKYIERLETLTIFGIKAQYMEDFRKFLELEDMPTNDAVHDFILPVVSRYNEVKGQKLRVIKLKAGANFKKQAKRLLLDVPDEGFMQYLTKNKIVIDCRSKVQTIESTFSMQMVSVTEEHTLEKQYIRFLDFDRVYQELETYKNEKFFFNISLDKSRLRAIMETDGWYSLIIPALHIRFDSIEKREAYADYCVMVLKSYLEKFFKYEKAKWESPRLEYQELTAEDNNFISEYALSYTESTDNDTGADELEQFVTELASILGSENGIAAYEKSAYRGALVAFDFRAHLYAPLICIKKSGIKIQVSPVSLNEDEKRFVDLLKQYTESHEHELIGKNLFLLRNKSKVGMGFFEAGNFYPDYVLWIDTPDVQYITFIDPKGLRQVGADETKIEFYALIKQKEAELQSSCPEKRIVLNSFILSGTPYSELRVLWNRSKQELENKNVLFLEDEECIDTLIRIVM